MRFPRSLSSPAFPRLLRLALSLALLAGWVAPGSHPRAAQAVSSTVVISEFRTRGPGGGNDEFIELYNLSASAVDIGGWQVKGSNGSGAESVRVTINTGTVLPTRGHFLITNRTIGGYSGTVPGNLTYTLGITDDGGIALARADGAVADQVGMSEGSFFKEGIALAPLSDNQNQSYERRPGGTLGSTTDSDDNAADFAFRAGASDPQNLDSSPVPPVDHPSGAGSALPASAAAGDPLLLIVQVAPALSPTSSGLSVTGDLRPVGALAAQVFYDDGTHGDRFAGDLIFTFQAVIGAGIPPGEKILPISISDAEGRAGSAEISLAVIGSCGWPHTTVPAIQGSGAASPLAGSVVETEGVVAGDYQGASRLDGFFLQDPAGDADPATSDGIFVYLPSSNPYSSIDVHVGDRVRVRGTVNEYNDQTEIFALTDLRLCGQGTVAPTTVTLPQPAEDSLERFEGMLVVIPQSMTASENTWLDRYGQVTLSADGRMYNPTNGQSDTAALNARRMLVLDDGSSTMYPDPVPYIGMDATLRAGDTIRGLTGILDQGLSGVAIRYRLQPVSPVAFVRSNTRPAVPGGNGGLKVTSFNVDNYFTTLKSRGASTPEELDRQRGKIIAALGGIDADIAGLIEIENNEAAIDDLVSALNQATAPGSYAHITEPAPGTDQIKVSLVYKPGQVSPIGAARNYQVDSGGYPAVFERPPLAQSFRVLSSGATLTVIVNHFKSKGCDGATGADLDQGDGQGCWNAKRKAQAHALLDFISSLKAGSGSTNILVIGDLNAYGEEDPVRILAAGGLVSEIAACVPLAERYSYIFNGWSGYLDHALSTPSLHAWVSKAAIWHINADEPATIDYHTENKHPDLYEPNPFRSSDHDPLILWLDMGGNEKTFLPLVRR